MSDGTRLTRATYDRLQLELTDRAGRGRDQILERINRARCEEGPLHENAAYQLAKDEQGINEARIQQLQELLDQATVGGPTAPADQIALGRVVTVRFDDGETVTFLLGSREEAPSTALDVYSPSSPLGAAILGKRAGQTIAYRAPNGVGMRVQVLRVEDAG